MGNKPYTKPEIEIILWDTPDTIADMSKIELPDDEW